MSVAKNSIGGYLFISKAKHTCVYEISVIRNWQVN